jgi:hypothetical protein
LFELFVSSRQIEVERSGWRLTFVGSRTTQKQKKKKKKEEEEEEEEAFKRHFQP